jgi:exonuclease III
MDDFWNWLTPACDLIVDRKAVLCGDFNTGVDEVDGPPKYRFRGASPFTDLGAHGWRDAYRALHPEGKHGSWWNKERGFRIDHCMLSRGLAVPRQIDYLRQMADIGPSPSSPSEAVMPAISDHAAMVIDF